MSNNYRDLRYRLAGPMAPLPILYTEDLAIDHAAMERYVDWLLVGGIKNVCFTFMFSEMDFLSTSELIEVTRTVANVTQGRGTFIACTAGGPVREMVTIVDALHQTGADVVMIHPPQWAVQGVGGGATYVEYLRCSLKQTGRPIMCCLLPEPAVGPTPQLTIDHFKQLVEYDNFIGMKDDIYVLANRMNLVNTFGDRLAIVGGGDLRQYISFHHFPCQGEFAGHFHPQWAGKLFSLMDNNDYSEAVAMIESQTERHSPIYDSVNTQNFLAAIHVIYYAMGVSNNYSVRLPALAASKEDVDFIVSHVRKHPDLYAGLNGSLLPEENGVLQSRASK